MEGQERDPDEDDNDQDRKPPAKVIHFTKQTATPTPSQGELSAEDHSIASASASMPAEARTPRLVAATPEMMTPYAQNTSVKKAPATTTSTSSRSWIQEEIILLSGTSLLSVLTFLYVMLPVTALMSLAMFLTSSSALLYTLYQYTLSEYESIIAGRGLGQYLPTSVYRTLTEQSLHENLTDPTFALEYRHLILYFLPLSAAQRDAFIGRLAPDHRATLFRRGLGNLLGPGFMRILMGEQQQQIGQQPQQIEQQQQQQQPRQLEASETASATAVIPTTPRRLYDDDSEDSNSNLGLDVEENDLAGGLDVQQATAMARYLGLGSGRVPVRNTDDGNGSDAVTNETVVVQERDANDANANADAAATPDDDRQEEYAAEEVVLMDAFWSALDESFWSPMYQYVTDTTAQLIQPATRPLLRGSLGVTLLSGSIGIWGYWNGVYNRPSFSNYRVDLPSSRTIWSTALLGGASAGLIILGRSYFRSSAATTSKSATESESLPDDDQKKKQK
jgi:hypothetical protein